MKIANRKGTGKQGFTLFELTIALCIVGIVLGSMTGVFDSSRRTYRQASATAQVQNEARRALDRLAVELENGGFGTLLPNPVGVAADDMVFQVAVGVDPVTGTVLFGNSSRLRFRYEQGEMDNGLDDDGDGLIDEGCIELTKNYLQANAITVILAHGITELLEGEIANGVDDNGNGLADESGFCMTRTGNLLRVRISVARPVTGGTPAIATVDTALRLKN